MESVKKVFGHEMKWEMIFNLSLEKRSIQVDMNVKGTEGRHVASHAGGLALNLMAITILKGLLSEKGASSVSGTSRRMLISII